ncbi:putative Muconate cycloisomerase [Nitrospira sp. KM1]|nr:putative Muconate cycloisomerase [Nitrospira sp. KM1]
MRVTLEDSSQGYGEAAPFPEVGGEDRASCVAALQQFGEALVGRSVHGFTEHAAWMKTVGESQPAARCALETAMLDAYCRSLGVSMWRFWGAADVRKRETDITIPICSIDKTLELAAEWYARGFRLFKMKVGRDVIEDVRRLEAVHHAFPGISFIGDGNQGFSRDECLFFAEAVKRFGGMLALLEQPLDRNDLEGLAIIRRNTGVPVAADESVRSLSDLKAVIREAAADYVNIKIMKTGVIEARAIAVFALEAGLKLMIGGMVESRVAMACSFSMVLGMRGFDILDLDTPLLLAEDPIAGGYRYDGATLHPWSTPGLGLTTEPVGSAMRIE